MKSNYRKLLELFTVITTSLAFSLCGCKKSVQVAAPTTLITSSNVYTTDATAISVATSIYTQLSEGSFATGVNSISLEAGLSADEFQGTSTSLGSNLSLFYENSLTNVQNLTFWESFYTYLHAINTILEGVSNSSTLTPAVKQQLQGESKFMRAFINFYLVTLYGDVPLATTSNYEVNATLSRMSQAEVWQQIIADLKDAKTLLSSTYLDATLLNTTNERVRPTSWAATALLARSYLYNKYWDSAKTQATSIIDNSSMYNLDTLNGVFLKNSTEAIWQLQPVNTNYNTLDALYFILTSVPSSPYENPVFLSSNIIDAFEPGDNRRINWVGAYTSDSVNYYYFPYKYKVGESSTLTEYLMVLRLAEQYLIRAEAEAELNDLPDAASDLNMIRTRAGLTNISASIAASQTGLLSAILHERQVELFTEWGHRWLDLKRTGSIDTVMGPPINVCANKGGNWNTDWQWYPIPLYDLQTDLNLTQNAGY